MKVIRHHIADYLAPISEGNTQEYALMGVGFSALDEQPSAKVDKTAYINDTSTSGTITGYENKFAFDTQLISDEAAIKQIYDVARNQKVGSEAEAYYVRVELFEGEEGASSYPARRFKVAIEVSNINGAGTEAVKVTGTLHQVGNFEAGTFDIKTKTFTPAAA